MDQNAALNVQLLQAQRRRAVLGHFHMPYKPSRLRLLAWRIFRPAKYRAWKRIMQCTYVVGREIDDAMGYNKGPSAWQQSHAVIVPNGPRQVVSIGDGNVFRPMTTEEAEETLARYRAAYPEFTALFRSYHAHRGNKP